MRGEDEAVSLNEIITGTGLAWDEEPARRLRLAMGWLEVVGAGVAAHTQVAQFDGGTLVVQVDDRSLLKQLLRMHQFLSMRCADTSCFRGIERLIFTHAPEMDRELPVTCDSKPPVTELDERESREIEAMVRVIPNRLLRDKVRQVIQHDYQMKRTRDHASS
ncbi:DUF721 domain-containing protein [bacterium]|nr:DUF721 domain-containing protein [candidate division CSSED10-310 bacterium]